jgi:hypothetical protein
VSLLASSYIARQHTSFDITYPTLLFTYDYANPGGFVELSDQDFDSFTAVPRLRQVNSLSILSYRYGHLPKLTGMAKDNPFTVSLTFSCATGRLQENQHLRKFQLYFRQAKGSNIDADSIRSNSSVESLLIAGNFFTAPSVSTKFFNDSVQEGAYKVFRSAAVSKSPETVRMFTQRVGTKDDLEFEQANLSNFKATLTYNGFINNAHNYTLLITWPTTTNIKGLYNIPKSRWIVFSIADMFQQVYLSGFIEKNTWDRLSTDNTNPAYNLGYNYLPTYLVKGLAGAGTALNNVTSEEITNINDKGYKQAVRLKNTTQVFRLKKSELKYINFNKTISFEVQNLIFNGGSTFNTHSNSFIMLDAFLVLAHKIGQAKNFSYLTLPGNAGNPIIHYKTYLTTDSNTGTYKLSKTIPNQIDLLINFADLEKAMKTSTKTKLDKNLLGGIYKVYIIPSLNKVPNSLNLPLYTTEYEINELGKLRLVTEFMIEYTWSP